ncbi:TIM44-like domain-containing protein [Pseudorhodoplanes sp.]|uniref:TIM44-like domain-containing protein n=1 Tax=Pseudorhodoplanes sp. TaxID=1934341 RepID=UPI00391A9F6C
MPAFSTIRLILCGLGAAALLAVTVVDADARRGGSFGSRGSKTYTAPPATQTAPNAASPINRTATQPQAAPRAGAPGAAAGGMFSRGGFMGGMLAGFLGAGLLGLLFGSGFLSGLSSFAGVLGLLIQIVLIVLVVRLLLAWWQRRQQGAYATAAGPALRDNQAPGQAQRPAYGGGSGATLLGQAESIDLTPADFDVFEQRLKDVNAAFSAEDIAKLRSLATPEIVGYFSEELSDNASRGLVNTVSDVKLEQGDLAEAWREGDAEYATVAMRYTSVDYTTQRATGQIVDGDKTPFERTELWTFRRSRGGEWLLSAIQES